MMIFGVPDVETENTEHALKPEFGIIQEKPMIMEATRLDRFVEGSFRPILFSRKLNCSESDCVEAEAFARIL